MRTSSIIVLLAIGLFCAHNAYSQSYLCKECKPWKISLYDIIVQSNKPQDSIAARHWINLYSLTDYYIQTCFATESRECFEFLDMSSSFNSRSTPGHQNTFGGPGTAELMDYVLDGSVTGELGAYTGTLRLHRAKDNVVVASGTVKFPSASAGDVVTAANDLKLALCKSSLKDLLCSIEKPMRDDASKNTAWNPKITMKNGAEANSIKAEPEEVIAIEFSLQDCDGAVLGSRHIEIACSEATFIPEVLNTLYNGEATTDERGNGVVYMRAPKKPGVYYVNFWYNYKRPSGKYGEVERNTASVTVKKVPTTSTAHIRVDGVSNERYYNSDHELTSTKELEQHYEADLSLEVIRERIADLKAHPERYAQCTGAGYCNYIRGSSTIEDTLHPGTGGTNTPVHSWFKSSEHGFDDEHKMIETFRSSANGTVSEYSVNLTIAASSDGANEYHLRPYLTVGGLSSNANTSGGIVHSEHYDVTLKAWITDECQGRCGVTVPNLEIAEAPVKKGFNGIETVTVVEPSFNTLELENYLATFGTPHTFKVMGKVTKVSPEVESEQQVWITLSFK